MIYFILYLKVCEISLCCVSFSILKLLTSKSVLRNDLDLVEGEIKLVEVLQLEKRLTGHLAQRVPGHVQAEQVPGEGVSSFA